MQYAVGLIEKMWKDVASHVREAIIFKTPDVIIGNLVSNTIMLVSSGMNPLDTFKYMNEGRMLMNKYRADKKNFDSMTIRKARGLSIDEAEFARTKRALASNPVKTLVDAGQFSAIIEETEIELDDTTNLVEKFGDKLTSKLPKQVRGAIDLLYLNKNTKAFQAIMKLVQYSDFVGKYALFKYMTEKKGASTAEAIDAVEEKFINYSLLQSKYIKYGSDIGGTRFTKYLFRIQKVIAKMMATRSSRMFATAALQHELGNVSDIADSALPFINANRFGLHPIDDIADMSHPHLLEMLGIH
jgi:hypothetical protein